MSSKQLDAVVLALVYALCAVLIFFFNLPLLALTVPLFGLPATYLLWRGKRRLYRDLLGALLLGAVFGFMVDYFGALNGAWTYHQEWFLFPYPIAGHVPLDIVLWAFVWALSNILFFEHFFDESASAVLSRRYLPMLIMALVGIANTLLFPVSVPLFQVPYAYLVWGLLSLIPLCAVVWLYPGMVRAVLAAGVLISVPNFLFEWAALKAGYWSFGGEYVLAYGQGLHALPLEELLFWTFGGSIVVLCNFLLFVRADD